MYNITLCLPFSNLTYQLYRLNNNFKTVCSTSLIHLLCSINFIYEIFQDVFMCYNRILIPNIILKRDFTNVTIRLGSIIIIGNYFLCIQVRVKSTKGYYKLGTIMPTLRTLRIHLLIWKYTKTVQAK